MFSICHNQLKIFWIWDTQAWLSAYAHLNVFLSARFFEHLMNSLSFRRVWIPAWIPEIHNSNLSECQKCSTSFIKMYFVFFWDAKFSDQADHMTINQVIGMSHDKQELMESGRYHDIIYHVSIMKNVTDFCHQFTHFLVWFFKSH